ncbi:MAG: hypothetical protein KGH56_02080 [Patescibacteria group bacterium]|nr:hypothetical protein [Patescibacteria group bacterium]
MLGLAESVAVGAQACVLQLWLEEPKLVVEVTKYNEQSAAASYSRWVGEFMTPPVPWAHFTSNAYELRARLIRKDGSVIEFAKLAEISEGGRELKHVQENMARRVAYFVFTADALAKAHELGYDK